MRWILGAALAAAACAGAAPPPHAPTSSPIARVSTPAPAVAAPAVAAPAVAAPAPAPPVPAAAGAPCFTDRPALPGVALFDELERASADDGARRLGTCTLDGGVLRAADGAAVATLDCALTTTVPGIVDDVGLGVGARGDLVLARHPGPADRFACLPEWRGDAADRSQPWTRCWIALDDDGDRQFEYVVAGATPPVPEGELFRGDAARAFFATRTVIAFRVRGDCH